MLYTATFGAYSHPHLKQADVIGGFALTVINGRIITHVHLLVYAHPLYRL
jgi:hypothetical protein